MNHDVLIYLTWAKLTVHLLFCHTRSHSGFWSIWEGRGGHSLWPSSLSVHHQSGCEDAQVSVLSASPTTSKQTKNPKFYTQTTDLCPLSQPQNNIAMLCVLLLPLTDSHSKKKWDSASDIWAENNESPWAPCKHCQPTWGLYQMRWELGSIPPL